MDKYALITGATGGIGEALSNKLAEAGYHLFLNYSSSQEKAEQLKKNLEKDFSDREFHLLQGDVSQSADVEAMVKAMKDVTPALDLLVNNAGITRDGLLFRMKEEDFDRVLDINLKGSFLTCKLIGKWMSSKRQGVIVNMSSIIGQIGNAGQANYAASKAGLIGLTQSVAKELGGRGIRCNAVAPGFIETPMTDQLSEEVRADYFRSIPMGRFGKAEEVADLVVFLASDSASYITGETIRISGGL